MLQSRGECGCGECGGFLTSRTRQTLSLRPGPHPSTPDERCLCGHPWWQHHLLEQNEFSRGKGGYRVATCGGFYPQNDTDPWTTRMTCVCTNPWLAHASVDSTTPDNGAVNALVPDTPHAVLPRDLLHAPLIIDPSPTRIRRPLDAFRTSAFDLAGSDTLQRRHASMQRARNARAASSDALRDHGSGTGNRRRPHAQSSTTMNAAVHAHEEFLVLCLPFQVATSGPTNDPKYKFSVDDFVDILDMLEKFNLLCQVSASTIPEVQVWKEMFEQISTHLKNAGIVARYRTSDITDSLQCDYFDWPLVLLHGQKRDNQRSFKSAGLDRVEFTFASISSKTVPNPRPLDPRRLLLFAPRFASLMGPVERDGVPHPCFPWRVWRGLQRISRTSENHEGSCNDTCPMGGQASVPSSESSAHLNSAIIIDVGEAVEMEPMAPSISATPGEVKLWQDRVYQAGDPSSEGLKAVGPTAEGIADALIRLLVFHKASITEVGALFIAPNGIQCEQQPLCSFVYLFHQLEIGTGAGRTHAFGDGPNRAVLRAGVKILTGKGFFGLRGDFYQLQLYRYPGSPRLNLLWAAGFWSAWHMITIGVSPDPISPWVLYAAALGKGGLPDNLDQIRALDPYSANLLHPWFDFHPEDTVAASDHQHPVHQLLVQYLEISDFIPFTTPRSPEVHRGTTQALIEAVLLGACDPWGTAEFEAFRDGFNIKLGGETTLIKTMRLPRRPNYCRRLLAAMCNRRITKISQISDRVTFGTTDNEESELNGLLRSLFQFRLFRWLNGMGHPTQSRGTHVPSEVFERESNDPLVRARLLLRAMTDSDLLPLDPSFVLRFTLNVPATSPRLDAPPVLEIHTCDTTASVQINQWLQNAMKEPCTLRDDAPTVFDIWFHSQVMSTSYNMV